VLLRATEAARAALTTLKSTSAALDIQDSRIKPFVRKKSAVEPVPPETPQLLPTVHALWSPLVNALKVPIPWAVFPFTSRLLLHLYSSQKAH
jgi:hypothetical protein